MFRSLWLTRVGVLLFPALSVGVFTAPASAATIGVASVSGTTVVYKAGSRLTNKVVITRSGRVITLDDRVSIKPGTGCKQVARDKSKVRCTTPKTPTRVSLYLYDRDDSVVNKTGLAITAYGGSGNDTLTGGPVGDSLYGGSGNDRIYGSAGNDTLDGGAGNDMLDGGAGNDNLDGAAGSDHLQGGSGNDDMIGDDDPAKISADVILGGSGTDWVSYWYATRPVTVDLDGSAGDDGQAGEHDTVGADVENLMGGLSNDHLTGNAAANWLEGSDGNDVLHGGGGNDTLSGDAGRDYLYGEAGDDFLMDVDNTYSDPIDTLDGGPNGTEQGDNCRALPTDILLNCERAN
jgi:serralysin